MSQKQDKSRIFVIILVIMVVVIIAIGLFFTWVIVKEGEKNKETSFNQPNETYVLMQTKTDLA